MIEVAWAQEAGGSAGISFLPLILIFGVMYFLLIRPQQKRQKRHREMLRRLKRGDKIITGGGVYAKVTKVVDAQTLEIEIAANIKIKISSATVSECLEPLSTNSGSTNSGPTNSGPTNSDPAGNNTQARGQKAVSLKRKPRKKNS